jgi:hypothetical protein
LIGKQAEEIIDEAVDLIMERARRSGSKDLPDADVLCEVLQDGLTRSRDEEPKVSLVFKDVTFEQTKSADFRKRVAAALPAHKRDQLGNWDEHFEAAREAAPEK